MAWSFQFRIVFHELESYTIIQFITKSCSVNICSEIKLKKILVKCITKLSGKS